MLRSCLLSDLLNCIQQFLSSFIEFRSVVSEEKLNMSQPIRSWGGHLVFLTGPKNTNLEEDTEILLPVKFCWILFSRFRGEVENVSADQRPGRPPCFSDRPEKHKLDRGHWDLRSHSHCEKNRVIDMSVCKFGNWLRDRSLMIGDILYIIGKGISIALKRYFSRPKK